MSTISRSLLFGSVLMSSLAFAGWTQDGEATATFDAKGPAGFKIHGVAEGKNAKGEPKVSVTDDGKNLKISLKIEDIDTDNGLRNKHMAEDTQAKDFPKVTLSVPLASLKETGQSNEATGTFEMHGQSKETKFTYTPKCAGGRCEIDGSANLNLNDFGIKVRSYLGVTVKPEITVGAKFAVKK